MISPTLSAFSTSSALAKAASPPSVRLLLSSAAFARNARSSSSAQSSCAISRRSESVSRAESSRIAHVLSPMRTVFSRSRPKKFSRSSSISLRSPCAYAR
ncbi:MAG: hypothetical protein ACLRSD_07360 [Oscillibacter sp.]